VAVFVVKVGTSTLVDAQGAFRDDILDARVRDLVRIHRQGHQPVLVTSAAIACGLARLGYAERPTALPDLQAASAVGQGILFERYLQAFTSHGVVPAQVLLTSADLERRASYVNARNTLMRLLELGAIPVVNENDTTATDDITFGDNDVLAAQVAILLRATWLLLLTDRDGLYSPGSDGPRLIGDVPAGTVPEDVELAAMDASGQGRGGISSKIASASMATAAGITCVIANGATDGVITQVAHGAHVGTRFPPATRPRSAFKLWLRYAKPAMGSILVDAGAASALEQRGTSLLAVGITGSRGTFGAGDAVEVTDPNGRVIGKGITGLSSDDVTQVAGLPTSAVRERLPGAPDEVIHRDQFVLVSADVV
jgi:glutamate 5-kinase